MLAISDAGAAVFPYEPKADVLVATLRVVRPRRCFPKGVAEAMDGPDEARMRGIVLERLANLGDKVDQVLFDDERVGPQPFLKIDLRQRFGPAGDENLQELKRFRSQRYCAVLTAQLARVEI